MKYTKNEFMQELDMDSEFIGTDEQYKELMYLNFILEKLANKNVAVSLATDGESAAMSSTYKYFDYQWGYEKEKPEDDAFVLYNAVNYENRTFISSKNITSVETMESDILPSVITVILNNGLQIGITEL